MPNTIKRSGDGLALQVTKPARAAGLVEETEDENIHLANIRVIAFDGLLLVVDLDRINNENIVELATSAALDTVSIHRVANASLQIAGNGYQVQLPGAADAGFHVGDRAPCTSAPNLLVIAAEKSTRVAADIAAIRREQV
ncbi:hypothetical protein SAMN05421858_4905 [Haladaptatus litoreus]|uniref:Uncharacterized protein n=1 Tax=Haladaptatus litoreus TaxID=553468 RepID=A0A1N7FBC8_9EURY|nr:hypothetical protein [Haladaptatus litoreus]SIR97629.1 hypothetical protein SAMN05421858_4905 [Haladaptatus litoreus]